MSNNTNNVQKNTTGVQQLIGCKIFNPLLWTTLTVFQPAVPLSNKPFKQRNKDCTEDYFQWPTSTAIVHSMNILLGLAFNSWNGCSKMRKLNFLTVSGKYSSGIIYWLPSSKNLTLIRLWWSQVEYMHGEAVEGH